MIRRGPPAAAGIYYPEHFADGDIFSWEAPFDYVSVSAGTVTVDDTDPVNFTSTANYVQVLSGDPNYGPVAATAANGEYYRLPPGTPTAPVNGTAAWTLTATAAGSYSVYFHIPDNIAGSGTTLPELRSAAVDYRITTTGLSAQTVTATASQTEANSSQFLAGPFQLAVGDTVTVTLQRDATHNQANALDYLIADSMTIQSTIGDVQSRRRRLLTRPSPPTSRRPNTGASTRRRPGCRSRRSE